MSRDFVLIMINQLHSTQFSTRLIVPVNIAYSHFDGLQDRFQTRPL